MDNKEVKKNIKAIPKIAEAVNALAASFKKAFADEEVEAPEGEAAPAGDAAVVAAAVAAETVASPEVAAAVAEATEAGVAAAEAGASIEEVAAVAEETAAAAIEGMQAKQKEFASALSNSTNKITSLETKLSTQEGLLKEVFAIIEKLTNTPAQFSRQTKKDGVKKDNHPLSQANLDAWRNRN